MKKIFGLVWLVNGELKEKQERYDSDKTCNKLCIEPKTTKRGEKKQEDYNDVEIEDLGKTQEEMNWQNRRLERSRIYDRQVV